MEKACEERTWKACEVRTWKNLKRKGLLLNIYPSLTSMEHIFINMCDMEVTRGSPI